MTKTLEGTPDRDPAWFLEAMSLQDAAELEAAFIGIVEDEEDEPLVIRFLLGVDDFDTLFLRLRELSENGEDIFDDIGNAMADEYYNNERLGPSMVRSRTMGYFKFSPLERRRLDDEDQDDDDEDEQDE